MWVLYAFRACTELQIKKKERPKSHQNSLVQAWARSSLASGNQRVKEGVPLCIIITAYHYLIMGEQRFHDPYAYITDKP